VDEITSCSEDSVKVLADETRQVILDWTNALPSRLSVHPDLSERRPLSMAGESPLVQVGGICLKCPMQRKWVLGGHVIGTALKLTQCETMPKASITLDEAGDEQQRGSGYERPGP
jgi:hypothetical protein